MFSSWMRNRLIWLLRSGISSVARLHVITQARQRVWFRFLLMSFVVSHIICLCYDWVDCLSLMFCGRCRVLSSIAQLTLFWLYVCEKK